MISKEICLLNDSFPPSIDGVSNTVVNYARVLTKNGTPVSVATPSFPGADDSGFDYPVIRYPSLDLRKTIGYTAGNPFSIPSLLELKNRDIGLLHSHCPAMSNMVARSIRKAKDVPMIMTYHTKFDIDIANIVKSAGLQHGVIRALVDSVGSCDELWVVSRGAGENIRSLGYEGDYIVMPNGVDMPRMRASEEEVLSATEGYDLPKDVPVFLFVGRLMWYKGLRIILDAVAALRSQDLDFRMIFIGGGGDEAEVKAYSESLNLGNKVFFTGPIRDRAVLSAWYARADLFLFPSTFDTNGLVVREAAASSLGTVMIRNSCASEGVTNNVDGLLIDENAASLAVCLAKIMSNKEAMRALGEKASENLYYSWDDAVLHAAERYQIVMDNYASGVYKKRHKFSDEVFSLSGDLIKLLSAMETHLRD